MPNMMINEKPMGSSSDVFTSPFTVQFHLTAKSGFCEMVRFKPRMRTIRNMSMMKNANTDLK